MLTIININLKFNIYNFLIHCFGEKMEEKVIHKKEEKLWSEIRGYQVVTNNARFLGILEELIINERTGKIVDIAVKFDDDRNLVPITGGKVQGDLLLIPFAKVEKVGEFIIVTE